MDKRDQSKKDEIILRQLEVIRSMTEHNLSRMGADFWGTPTPEKHVPVAPLPEKEKRIPPADGGEKKAPEAAEQKQEDTAKAPPKENIEDLQKELDSYVGLSAVKREVKDLINLAAVERLRRQHGLPTADETVLEIHRCGGLAILAHPFAQTDANPALFPIRPDAVETACASVVPPNSAAGQRALLWATEHQRPRVGGSNARSPRELGTVYTEISCPRLSRAFLKEALDLGRCRPVCVRPETTPQSRRPSPARAGKTAASVVKSVAVLGLCRLGGLLPLPRQPKKHPGKKPKK